MIRELFERRELRRFVRHAASILTLIALATAPAWSQEPAPGAPVRGSNPQRPGTNEERGTDAAQGVTEPPTTVPDQPPAEPAQIVIGQVGDDQDDGASSDGLMALFTFLLVLVGAGQVFIGWRQSRITEAQARIALAQKRIGDRQLEQMQTQATIAEASSKASEKAALAASASADAIKITERAQIGVPHTGWSAEYDPANPDVRYRLKLSYSILNAGQTMGFFTVLIFNATTGVGPDDRESPMAFSTDDHLNEMEAVILPGQSIPRSATPFFLADQQEIDDIIAGKLAYWTLGRISYRDIFGNVHYTNFTSRFYFPSRTFSFPLEKGYADGN